MESKSKKPTVMDDDFVDNSERPYSDMPHSTAARPQWSLDQYLTWQFLLPTICLGIGTLYILHRLNVFQVIWVLMVAVILLVLSVIIVAYLDNSLTAESADLVTRIDLRDWKTVRAALQRTHANSLQGSNANPPQTAPEEDEDDIFDGTPPFFGQPSISTSSSEDLKLQVLQNALQSMKGDLLNHIDNQRRHANIQVVMGILASLVGITVLVAASLNKVGSVSMSYSQVVVSGVIALFVLLFLSQYQSTQQRIKFFQNELTNLNARIAAFQLAYLLDEDKTMIALLLKDLIGTERNFKLSKNEMLS
jgi:hypothetical protein